MSTEKSEIIPGRLVRLQAENIQNLVAIDIPLPDEGAVCIGGKNGAGKSSVLACIAYALGGADELPSDPIRLGEETGKILLEFEGITVKLKLTLQDDRTVNRYLVIESKDGSKYPSPQALLNRLTGKLAFDPLEFSTKPPKEQLEMLHKFLGIDFTAVNAERKKYYEERTVQNRFLEAATVKLGAAQIFSDVPEVPVEVKDVNAELEAALAKNREVENAASLLARATADVADKTRHIKTMLATLAEAEKELKIIVSRVESLQAASPKEKIDTAPILARLQGIQQTNAKIAANQTAASLKKEKGEREAEVQKLTAQIEAIDAQKKAVVEQAEYPLDGMGVTDNEVTFNGVRFSQLNDATKIAVSCAMGLSLNPKLKLMVIRQGCHLDDEMLGVVRDMAKQAGALILVERVGEGKECKVIIADGNVKEIRA